MALSIQPAAHPQRVQNASATGADPWLHRRRIKSDVRRLSRPGRHQSAYLISPSEQRKNRILMLRRRAPATPRDRTLIVELQHIRDEGDRNHPKEKPGANDEPEEGQHAEHRTQDAAQRDRNLEQSARDRLSRRCYQRVQRLANAFHCGRGRGIRRDNASSVIDLRPQYGMRDQLRTGSLNEPWRFRCSQHIREPVSLEDMRRVFQAARCVLGG